MKVGNTALRKDISMSFWNRMMSSRSRWFGYGLVGILFGIADWYYLDGLAHFPWGPLENIPFMVLVVIGLNYGIWLLPVLPVTFFESRKSRLASRSALAGAICWSSSILSYYAYYAVLLALGMLPNLENLNILGEKPAGFWQDFGTAFHNIILDQVLEWLPIALIGGVLVGLFVGWISVKKAKRL